MMSEIQSENDVVDPLAMSKKMVATVYLCQALTFMLAGLPLIVGMRI